jgi:hypothetical protein
MIRMPEVYGYSLRRYILSPSSKNYTFHREFIPFDRKCQAEFSDRITPGCSTGTFKTQNRPGALPQGSRTSPGRDEKVDPRSEIALSDRGQYGHRDLCCDKQRVRDERRGDVSLRSK